MIEGLFPSDGTGTHSFPSMTDMPTRTVHSTRTDQYSSPLIRRSTLVFALLLWTGAALPSVAQQQDSRIEVYGLTGIYSPGVGRDRFSPQAGAGVLLPVGRRWAAVVDFGIGVAPVHRKFRYVGHSLGRDAAFYRRNPHLPSINEHWTNEATLRPSFARVWRRDRFSFWLGAGVGAKFEYNRWRHKRAQEVHDGTGSVIPVDDEEPFGLLVLDEHFNKGDSWSPLLAILGSFGSSVSLTERAVVRFGYSCGLTYLDEPLAGGIEVGIGYRF